MYCTQGGARRLKNEKKIQNTLESFIKLEHSFFFLIANCLKTSFTTEGGCCVFLSCDTNYAVHATIRQNHEKKKNLVRDATK